MHNLAVRFNSQVTNALANNKKFRFGLLQSQVNIRFFFCKNLNKRARRTAVSFLHKKRISFYDRPHRHCRRPRVLSPILQIDQVGRPHALDFKMIF